MKRSTSSPMAPVAVRLPVHFFSTRQTKAPLLLLLRTTIYNRHSFLFFIATAIVDDGQKSVVEMGQIIQSLDFGR